MKRIILDTDIGDDIDDAFAIAMLLRHKQQVQLEGITTVFRNSVQRAKLTKRLLAASGNGEIPVYSGVDIPRKQKIYIAPYETMGENGLVNIPHYYKDMDDETIDGENGVDFILETLRNNPVGEITLVAIGPLSNLAAAYEKDGETFGRAKEILLMGGQLGCDYTEWNVKCDPEAADIVFRCGLPITMITLEMTKQCELTDGDVQRLLAVDTEEGKLLGMMLKKWLKDNNGRRPPIMYDGLTVQELLSSYCDFEEIALGVELQSEKRGMLKRDQEDCTKMQVSVNVRARDFVEKFLETIC